MSYADDFIYLHTALSNCVAVQFKIAAMRAANPGHSELQLALDRKQTALDEKKAGLEEVITAIAVNN